jgi:hypothetical protein
LREKVTDRRKKEQFFNLYARNTPQKQNKQQHTTTTTTTTTRLEEDEDEPTGLWLLLSLSA